LYPGSFIWKRFSDAWLVSKHASRLLGLSAFIIVGMSIILVANRTQAWISDGGAFLGAGGVLAAVSVFFIWGGMWRYWMICDSSSLARRLWFAVMVFGLWYGAIIYYALVYLPRARGFNSTKHFEP